MFCHQGKREGFMHRLVSKSCGHPHRYVETWAGYIAMEVGRRHLAQARTLYRRAHARNLEAGGQLQLCNAWLRFEREHGEPATHLEACLKVEPILAAAAAAHQAAAHPDAKVASPLFVSSPHSLSLSVCPCLSASPVSG